MPEKLVEFKKDSTGKPRVCVAEHTTPPATPTARDKISIYNKAYYRKAKESGKLCKYATNKKRARAKASIIKKIKADPCLLREILKDILQNSDMCEVMVQVIKDDANRPVEPSDSDYSDTDSDII